MTHISENQRATSLQKIVARACNQPATNSEKQVTEMVTEMIEQLVKEAFPDKSYNVNRDFRHANTLHIEVYVGFNERRVMFYDFTDKALAFSTGDIITSCWSDKAYFRTKNQQLIDDKEFLIKILRHPRCFL